MQLFCHVVRVEPSATKYDKELVMDLSRAEALMIPVLTLGVRQDTGELQVFGVHTSSNMESVAADLYAVVCWDNRVRAKRLNKLI